MGDTVGDPFKDTSGPSLNILLKLMSVVALVSAPSIAIIDSDSAMMYNTSVELHENVMKNEEVKKMVKIKVDEDGNKKATVTTTTTVNGEEKVETETLEGDDVEELIEKHKEKYNLIFRNNFETPIFLGVFLCLNFSFISICSILFEKVYL